MAAANDSQGLKIAVASFVSLSVILAVTSYFMYSNYSAEAIKAAEAANKATAADNKFADQVRVNKDLRHRIGGGEYDKYETPDTLNNAIKAAEQKWQQKLAASGAEIAKIFDAQGGAKSESAVKAKELSEQLLKQVLQEPQGTFNSWIDRMVDMTTAQTNLTLSLIGDNSDLRTNLEGVNQSNDAKVKHAEGEADQARKDQTAEHNTYEQERKSFLDKMAAFQELTGKQAAEVAGLKGDIERLNQDHEKRVDQLLAQMKDLQVKNTTLVGGDNSIGHSQGRVTFVDHTRKEVRTTLSRRQGARERMRLAVYDRSASGPSDKPKATIELISVNDRDSVGKVLNLSSDVDQIRDGDQVYSAAFGKKKFALIGRMDINRDGRDDRDTVRRMIEMSGGEVSYDLPPPGQGTEKGQLAATIDWAVTDDSTPIFGGRAGSVTTLRDISKETGDFLKRRSDVVKEAGRLGLQPMPLTKLAGYLGYTPSMILPGQVESIDKSTSNALQKPSGNRAVKPDPSPEPAANKPREDEAEDAADPK